MGIVIVFLRTSQYKLWIPSKNVAVHKRDVDVVDDTFPVLRWDDPGHEQQDAELSSLGGHGAEEVFPDSNELIVPPVAMSTRVPSAEGTPMAASRCKGGTSPSEGQNDGNVAVPPVADDPLEVLTYLPGASSQESEDAADGSGLQNDEIGHESRYIFLQSRSPPLAFPMSSLCRMDKRLAKLPVSSSPRQRSVSPHASNASAPNIAL